MFNAKGIDNLINAHGVTATYTSKGSGSYTVGTGYTSGSDTPEQIKVYYSSFLQEEIDGQSVLMGDRKAVFVPKSNTIKPKNGDTIGNTRVEGVREIMSGDAVVYVCHVRDFSG